MKVLAIDPGNEQSAFVLWDGKVCLNKDKIPNVDLLHMIHTDPNIDEMFVVIERVASYGMAVGQTVFDTVEWAGRFYEAALTEGAIGVHRVFRKDVKMHWCHSTRAKDSNIIQAIKDRFGEKGSKKNGFNKVYNDEVKKMKADIWQAFALGVYFFDSHLVKA